jgi:YbbR domain-containing protein
MRNTQKRKYKTTKIRAFFLFLLVAIVFWALAKFSNNYTATITAPLDYTNVPPETTLSNDNLAEISFDLTANGFKFLLYKLKSPTVVINVSEYYNPEDKTVVLSGSDLVKAITEQLDKNSTVENVSVPELNIKLAAITLKKIPVVVSSQLTFRDGYKAVNGFKLVPDSVTVSGSEEHVEKLDSARTKVIALKNIERNISDEIMIDTTGHAGVFFNPMRISYTLEVSEFTQKQLDVAVKVINVPSETTIKIIPEVVTITFEISVEHFNDITKDDFNLICDFEKRDKGENFMILELTERPEGVLNIEFSEKKIDFLVFKQ